MEKQQLINEMKDFDNDTDVLNKSLNALKKEFLNKFVAFKDGKVVAHGCTMDELIENANGIDLGVCVIQLISEKDALFIL